MGIFQQTAIWSICSLSILGMLTKPLKIPEWQWIAGGAFFLLVTGLLSPTETLAGIARSVDLNLFLIGMMLLAELARFEGIFDWVARFTVRVAQYSRMRLFLFIYAVGTLVTIVLSNDATVVVLTPAVAAAVRNLDIDPLPYVYACAFVANAASFVLPISNPANLVIFAETMPDFAHWLHVFALPSCIAILVTAVLIIFRWYPVLQGSFSIKNSLNMPAASLTKRSKIALAGILLTALALVIASCCRAPLGLVTGTCGLFTLGVSALGNSRLVLPVLRSITWSVVLLVSGLFILMTALEATGILSEITQLFRLLASWPHTIAHLTIAAVTAIAANGINNLPAGLIASSSLAQIPTNEATKSVVAISIDLSPNASVSGSLATVLWLIALRREGIEVSAWSFLKIGAFVMPPALLLAILAVSF